MRMGEHMSSARIPGSLRRPVAKPATRSRPRKDTTTGLVTAAILAAASPTTIALAQSTTPGGPLPPLSVEAKQPRKKAPAAAKKAGTVTPAPVQAPQLTPDQKNANPYANPNAPYKVEQSASPKLTEPLADTPRTVTAVPKEVLADTATNSIRELARQTPGVTLGFAEGGNAFGDRIYIRGFDARGDIFVDGLRDPGNTSREVFAVEQIEVYKGPGSAISGRGTPGGAVNIITKKPYDDRNFYNFSTMLGTDKTVRTTADVNQVISPSLAVRGNVMYHQSEVAGRDFTEDERWGGLFAVTFKPTDAFKITIDYYRLRTDGVPDWGVPLNINTKVPWTESGLPRETWFGNINRDFIANHADAVTATIEAKLASNVKLTSKTRFSKNSVDYIASLPQDPNPNDNLVNVGNPQRFQEIDSLAHQSDVTIKFNTGPLLHTMVAGIEISRDNIERYSYSSLGATPAQPLFNPNPFRSVPPNYLTRTWVFDGTVDTKAAYLLDTIKLSEQWSINGGVRVDNFERTQVGAAANNTATREDTLFNWHAGIVYRPIPIARFYAAYATAANPGGNELDATGVPYNGLGAGLVGLDPEETTGIEVGTKWELFNRHLLATLALFQTEKKHARENVGACDAVTLVCTAASTGAYRVRGVELSAQGKITERWSVYGGLVVMETEVTESAIASNIGRRLANIPTQQFSLLSKYRLTDQLTIGGQAVYSNEVYNGHFAVTDLALHTVPHWRFDALAEYKFTEHFSAQVNVLNLTNELYYDALYQGNNHNAFVAPGRAAYLTLNWKY
jgi:catecholate siderophore receptor